MTAPFGGGGLFWISGGRVPRPGRPAPARLRTVGGRGLTRICPEGTLAKRQRPRRVVASSLGAIHNQFVTAAEILAVCAAVTALLGIARVFWKAAEWKGGVDTHLKTGEEYRKTVTDFMKEIRDDFREVRGDIKKLFQEIPKETVKSKSPTRLNELGVKVSSGLGAEQWARTRAETLSDEVSGMEPYQIDLYAFDYVYGEFSHRDADMAARVMKCAYEFGLSRDNVLAVLQVVLRDALISRLGLKEDAS